MTDLLARGELVGIRPVAPEDDRILYDIQFDPDVQRNLNYREDDAFEAWAENKKRQARRYWLECIVVSLEDDKPAGYVSLGSIDFDPALVVLLLPSYRGRGIGTEAARLIIDYGFRVMGIAGIQAGTKHFNLPCQRMLDGLGFVRDPERDESTDNAWGEDEVAELAYHLDKENWRG